jgi:alpha-D-ribose 1-methylphosphonate 5-triphosphate synthase subunit PhnH
MVFWFVRRQWLMDTIILEETMKTQRAFRALLQAMSHPGRIYPLSGDTDKNSGLMDKAGLMLVLRTLLDHEVRFSVAGPAAGSLEKAVFRLTGSRSAPVADADFVVIPGGKSEGAILRARRGTLEYPDSGATAIYAVESFERVGTGVPETSEITPRILPGASADLATAVLTGPGIRDEIAISIVGTTPQELADIREATADFPLGIDCVFVDGAGMAMCIPRSTRIEAC